MTAPNLPTRKSPAPASEKLAHPVSAVSQLKQDIQEGVQSGSAGNLDVEAIKRRGRARQAAADINARREGVTLDGLKIKDLINEGRS